MREDEIEALQKLYEYVLRWAVVSPGGYNMYDSFLDYWGQQVMERLDAAGESHGPNQLISLAVERRRTLSSRAREGVERRLRTVALQELKEQAQ